MLQCRVFRRLLQIAMHLTGGRGSKADVGVRLVVPPCALGAPAAAFAFFAAAAALAAAPGCGPRLPIGEIEMTLRKVVSTTRKKVLRMINTCIQVNSSERANDFQSTEHALESTEHALKVLSTP
jgi:hypothetical protein